MYYENAGATEGRAVVVPCADLRMRRGDWAGVGSCERWWEMSNPMTTAEILQAIRTEQVEYPCGSPQWKKLRTAANLIESLTAERDEWQALFDLLRGSHANLTEAYKQAHSDDDADMPDFAKMIQWVLAERDGLAGMVMQLREALEKIALQKLLPHMAESVADTALALELPAAVAQVQKWKKQARLLDWLLSQPQCAGLTCHQGADYVEFTLRIKESYGPQSFDEYEWTKEQVIEALLAAKEAENVSK